MNCKRFAMTTVGAILLIAPSAVMAQAPVRPRVAGSPGSWTRRERGSNRILWFRSTRQAPNLLSGDR